MIDLSVNTDKMASCNGCGARNYTSAVAPNDVPMVRRLWRVAAGRQDARMDVVTLFCDGCLDALGDQILTREN